LENILSEAVILSGKMEQTEFDLTNFIEVKNKQARTKAKQRFSQNLTLISTKGLY